MPEGKYQMELLMDEFLAEGLKDKKRVISGLEEEKKKEEIEEEEKFSDEEQEEGNEASTSQLEDSVMIIDQLLVQLTKNLIFNWKWPTSKPQLLDMILYRLAGLKDPLKVPVQVGIQIKDEKISNIAQRLKPIVIFMILVDQIVKSINSKVEA